MAEGHESQSHLDRIVTDPEILGGKPVVKGTRIPVDLILDYLSHNPNFQDLFADYPRLTMADVQACFAYAHHVLERRARGPLAPPPRRRAV